MTKSVFDTYIRLLEWILARLPTENPVFKDSSLFSSSFEMRERESVCYRSTYSFLAIQVHGISICCLIVTSFMFKLCVLFSFCEYAHEDEWPVAVSKIRYSIKFSTHCYYLDRPINWDTRFNDCKNIHLKYSLALIKDRLNEITLLSCPTRFLLVEQSKYLSNSEHESRDINLQGQCLTLLQRDALCMRSTV